MPLNIRHLLQDVEMKTDCLLIIFLHWALKCWREPLSLRGPKVWLCCCGQLHLCSLGNFKVSRHIHISLGCLLYSHFNSGSSVTRVLLSACPGCWILLGESFEHLLHDNMPLAKSIQKLALRSDSVWMCAAHLHTHARDYSSGLLTGHGACCLSFDRPSLLARLSFVMHRASLPATC